MTTKSYLHNNYKRNFKINQHYKQFFKNYLAATTSASAFLTSVEDASSLFFVRSSDPMDIKKNCKKIFLLEESMKIKSYKFLRESVVNIKNLV